MEVGTEEGAEEEIEQGMKEGLHAIQSETHPYRDEVVLEVYIPPWDYSSLANTSADQERPTRERERERNTQIIAVT